MKPKAYSVREIDRRCEELAARERARREGHSSEVTVRWVEPRPSKRKRNVKNPAPTYKLSRKKKSS